MSTIVTPTAGVARLRPRNQLTLPDRALKAVGARIGDRLLVSVEDGSIRIQPIHASYAGAFADLYPAGWEQELRADRDAWRP